MNSNAQNGGRPTFYKVREAAHVMCCNPSTLYAAIGEGTFPAVRIHTRYVVPPATVDELASGTRESGGCVAVARRAQKYRTAREATQVTGGAVW